MTFPTYVVKHNYQYFMQELVHKGPVIDLKFDPHFGRVASVGNGFPQVSQLLTTDDGEHFLVPGKFVCINGNLLENRGPATHGFIS
jgi:hypothetical protein